MAKREQGHLYDDSATYEYQGRTLNVREWSRSKMCKCSLTALRQRITKGWTFSTAMSTPTGERAKSPTSPGPKAKPEWQKRSEMLQAGYTHKEVADWAKAKNDKRVAKQNKEDEKKSKRKENNWATG